MILEKLLNYKNFKNKFLNPKESNRNNLLKNISYLLGKISLPKFQDQVFINSQVNEYAELRKFESLPQIGRKESDVLDNVANLLSGGLRFHSPSVMENINPPTLLSSITTSTITNLFNMNLLWDYVSAGVQDAEQQIIRQFAKLAGWDPSLADGVFTYGGKGCFTYAIRIGLNRCFKDMNSNGVNGRNPVVITSERSHYIIENVCSLLGIGKKSCVRVKVQKDSDQIDLDDFKSTLEKYFSNKTPVATIIISGGQTINVELDPVEQMCSIVDDLIKKYQIKYKPFIYFDTVVSWPWMFFKSYDFKENKLKITSNSLEKISKIVNKLNSSNLVDGFGTDFHKNGFCPYNNSTFFVKNKSDLHSIFSDEKIIREREDHGYNFLQHHTLEHSRSSAPVLAAWTTLQSVGIEGFQMYVGQLTMVGEVFQKILPTFGFDWINKNTQCQASVFYVPSIGGPKTFNELYNSKSTDVKKASEYLFKFYKFLLSGGSDPKHPIQVGFLKKLKSSRLGEDMSAIRIFPMSPFTTLADAKKLALRIVKLKDEFDNTITLTKLKVPEVIHK
ncbi:hypothetical protein KBD45_04865 [Candidatus Dojkabacteria bacterium]|nr:hypothetical protein [Candidatus Dojkabacteria bacterium]